MDLPGEVLRLRLDLLAVRVSAALRDAGVPHALLKGPTTATWLYDPPRGYRDVDLLIPAGRVRDARRALESGGIARADAGGIGELAEHSLVMHADGLELDLHRSLPTLPVGPQVWTVLAGHLVDFDLGVGTVPALDEPARCVVLALHALNSAAEANPAEDLRRARAQVRPEVWVDAAELAERMGARAEFDAGLGRVEPGHPIAGARAVLHAEGGSSVALGLQRLAEAPWRRRPLLLWRELFPSRGLLRQAFPQFAQRPVRAYFARLRRLLRELPAGWRAWRVARHAGRQAHRGRRS